MQRQPASPTRPPELPRVQVNIKMPATPAPGRRVIRVEPPKSPLRPKRASVAVSAGALALVLTVLVWQRRRRLFGRAP